MRFAHPPAPPAPGQSAVFYQDDVILGGGFYPGKPVLSYNLKSAVCTHGNGTHTADFHLFLLSALPRGRRSFQVWGSRRTGPCGPAQAGPRCPAAPRAYELGNVAPKLATCRTTELERYMCWMSVVKNSVSSRGREAFYWSAPSGTHTQVGHRAQPFTNVQAPASRA